MSGRTFPIVEDYVTASQLARMMGLSESTIKRWVQAGMPSVTFGLRCRRFLPSQAIQWARHRELEERRAA